MKKYVLFDLDGTLTDPGEGITTCVQYALESFGIGEPDLKKLEPFIGPPLKNSFMQFYQMDEEQAEAAVAKYRERFQDKGIFENRLYEGIPDMLDTLQSKGMHLAVASSKPTVFVERILKHFEIDRYFEVVVGSELDGTRVEKEEVLLETLNRLFHYKPVRRDQVVMVGDRKFDVEGAQAHRIESVAVSYGYGSIEELKEAGADQIADSVAKLQELLLRDAQEAGPAAGSGERQSESKNAAERTLQNRAGGERQSESKNAPESYRQNAGQSTSGHNLKGNRQNGGQNSPQNGTRTGAPTGTPTQRIWALAFPFLMFLVVRGVFLNLEVAAMQSLSNSLTGAAADALFVRDEAGTLIGFTGSAGTVMTALAFVAGAIAIFPRAKVLIAKTAGDMKPSHPKREPAVNYVFLTLAVAGAVLGFNLLFGLTGFVEQSAAYQETASTQYSASLLIGLICYGVLTPIAEEILFRGTLYNTLRRFLNLKMAILISAFLFGGYHMNMIQGVYGFIIGCLIAYGYEYFGDFKVAAGIHIGANVIAYVFTFTGIFNLQKGAWPICIAALLVMAAAVGVLHKRKNILEDSGVLQGKNAG